MTALSVVIAFLLLGMLGMLGFILLLQRQVTLLREAVNALSDGVVANSKAITVTNETLRGVFRSRP